ncbi:DNA topoisomerase IV subunit A [Mycoplasmatota bacterium WC44]
MGKKKSLKQKLDILFTETIISEKLETVVSDRFGTYSKYIIQDRALPDVKDGLKPVQRRILYGMYKMGMFANKPYKKSARIVGEVMGKYHPHGDNSIYDAMVRLSQNWKTNMLLIDMHGNNGSIDGDSAAAMRYTEARLSHIAEELLKDINKNTVNFIPNFDDEEYEPIVLPSKYPNLLINGSTGISSGYATDIPPHNLNEVIEGTIYRIDNPNCELSEIMNFIKGPDFPTGATIQGLSGITSAYKTGKGKIVIRSKTEIDDDTNQIIITEIPYEINKAVLVRKIDEIRIQKKVPGIAEVRDESDRDGLRVVIDLRKDANASFILNYLYKSTDLQRNYSFNMVAIHNKRPVQMGLIDILDAYIMHQKDVITNRANYDLANANKRLHIVEGLIRMVDILDEVINTIRQSKNKSNAKELIIDQFNFSEFQAEAIVTLQLYRLSNTDINDLIKENNNLTKEISSLKKILSSENVLKEIIKDELDEIKKRLSVKRKSFIENEVSEIKITESELIQKEDVMVAVTKDGYIKRSSIRSYKASGEESIGLKEGDILTGVYEANTLDTLLLFTNKGYYLYLPVYKIADFKWKDVGGHISNVISIDSDEKIIHTHLVKDFNQNLEILIGTRNGFIKKTKLQDFEVQRYNKKMRAIKFKSDDEVIGVDVGTSLDNIAVFTIEGAAVKYPGSEVPLSGTNTSGVMSIKLKNRPNDKVVHVMYAPENIDSLLLTVRGNIIRTSIDKLELSSRNRKPEQFTTYIKSNPHDIIDAINLSKDEYKNNIIITLEAFEKIKCIEAYTIKYPQSDNGKNYLTKAFGTPISISKISRYIELDAPIITTQEEEFKEDPIVENIITDNNDVSIETDDRDQQQLFDFDE